MTLDNFCLLEEDQQVSVLYSKGLYIGKQKRKGLIIVLYQVNYFYVEVFYSLYRKEIDRILCFSNPAFIDPYLKYIDIHELVNCTTNN